jgi:hypothetical protein
MKQFSVEMLVIFGSVARGEDDEGAHAKYVAAENIAAGDPV